MVPMIANGTSIVVNVKASLDRSTRQLTLTLDAVDPATGWFPDDPLVGLLYPDDDTGRGVGSISYRVSPLAGLAVGHGHPEPRSDRLRLQRPDRHARGPQHPRRRRADQQRRRRCPRRRPTRRSPSTGRARTRPAARESPATTSTSPSTAAPSCRSSPTRPTTSTTVTVEPGHTYAFYSVATDNVGHVEAPPPVARRNDPGHRARATTTTLQPSEENPTYGDSLTFTATVAPDPSEPGTPTGTVQFLIDGADFGSPVALVAGTATSDPITTLAAGPHTISAIYSGDDTFTTSTAADLPLNVAKAPVTITADNKSKVYGAADPTLTYTVTGLLNGDSPSVISGVTLSTTTGAAATAGTHTIIATGGTAANYTITDVNGTLTVSQAPLTVTADNKSKVYGAARPDPDLHASPARSTTAIGPSVISGVTPLHRNRRRGHGRARTRSPSPAARSQLRDHRHPRHIDRDSVTTATLSSR